MEGGKRKFEDRLIKRQDLPQAVKDLRERQTQFDRANEEVATSRIDAHIAVSRSVIAVLEEFHQQIADETDLDLASYSRASARWLLAGRCLALLEALWVLIRGGVTNEALIMGRAIHEANRLLVAATAADDELLRLWLDDEGKGGYVRPKAARDAENEYEEKLADAVERADAEALERQEAKATVETLYDALSREAHNRRSACLSSLWQEGRVMAYGPNPSPLHRAYYVGWASEVTIEVVHYAGGALSSFLGGKTFFSSEVEPLREQIETAIQAFPLDEESIRAAAGTLDVDEA
jgi:hypothetical protein